MNIVCIEPLSVSREAVELMGKRFMEQGHTFIAHHDRPGTLKETAKRMREADIAIVTDLSVPKQVIDQTKHVKLLIVAFSNMDRVDADACRDKGIFVKQIEGYASYAVAELAVSMMIALLRSIIQANHAMRTGVHELPYLGRELNRKTIGIIGLGDVGIRVAKIAAALDCRILAYDMSPSGEAYQAGVTYVNLERLFQESDILSIHCPLTPQTRGMVDYRLLSLMKPSALVINVGRSPVIELEGLIRALSEKKIAGAGIDTVEKTEMEKDHRLLGFDNVIVTPHIGYRTEESLLKRAEKIEQQILLWLEQRSTV